MQVHHPGKFKDPLEYARWINQNVAALLGPHGGGLCNIKWVWLWCKHFWYSVWRWGGADSGLVRDLVVTLRMTHILRNTVRQRRGHVSLQCLGAMHPNALTVRAGACRWLARETLVLEFMPRSWINEALYAESYGHGVNYWVELLVGWTSIFTSLNQSHAVAGRN